MAKTKRNVSATGPDDLTDLRLKTPTPYAAGGPGIQQALKHSFKEMGVVRSMQGLLKMNQKEGFDCPSCAWPDPETPSRVAEYCENGAKALADEATTKRIDAEFFKTHSVEALSLLTDYEINSFGRLTEPMVLLPEHTHYQPISWSDAFQCIADTLHGLQRPDEAIFYTSGRSSNEAAFLYGMFARALGTNNLPDCSNMCHESSGVALGNTLGIGKGSVTLDDLYGAEVVIVAGQNPGTNHPRMLSALEKCKENGGSIISINPLRESGLVHFKDPKSFKGLLGSGQNLADIHLPVKINQDIPLVKLLLKKLRALDLETGAVFDHAFIETYTHGYDALMADLDRYSEADLIARCGISQEAIDRTVELLASKSKIVVCWAMGLTQHANGVANIQEFVNLLLLKGALGKPHAGTCPVRGHSNVQGDRSVGIVHTVDPTLNARIEKHLGFSPPTEDGYDTVAAISAMHQKKASFFMALGGNFLMAAPDTEYTAEALRQCRLTVQVSTKLNRSHLVTGQTALILPTIGRSEKDHKKGKEQFVTVENSMGKVHRSKGLFKPASDALKSEIDIIASIADAYFKDGHPMDWSAMRNDYERIRTKIDVVAKGFEDTQNRSVGSGYYLPNNVRERDFSKLPGGRAQFTLNEPPEHDLAEDGFLLMTIRSHDQFNTTIYGLHDRYRGVFNERRVLFMHEADMELLGVRTKDKVHLISNYDGVERVAKNFLVIPYAIPKRNLAAYFPETNVLVPHNRFAAKSRTPISKSIQVKVVSAT
ncbi:FdhF/YdeP family oxidoreductase [Flagellimonas sp. DF-77]|uniref:FdhF/YdeP family oxidoreductase n=1 Tax=Flagellimonas algarum TaxID=3230298 RepID=UPI003392121C